MTAEAEAVLHYKRKLSRHLDDESPEIVLHCLDKLEQVRLDFSGSSWYTFPSSLGHVLPADRRVHDDSTTC
jgi:hypothetical protein